MKRFRMRAFLVALWLFVAAFAAVAVTRKAVGDPVAPLPAMTEGWIAVHA